MFPGHVNQRKKNSVYYWYKRLLGLSTDRQVEAKLRQHHMTYPSGRINWGLAYENAERMHQAYLFDRQAWRREQWDGWLEDQGPRDADE